ncbi:uncharacterized protein LOC18425501 [Amborella trichopoda]|uniref:Uncharacterized protein n=1 Tax=Amborella trichopoda TaxID=13333 RepID=W1NR99_AMBTC|nr:uncharacterized protein LOC18425501 [Amborella trichopoda]XP_020517709.1 uncharacterized protein LOC18425501 [Amborella trichopoda]ERM97525.1 hypothetical protein AMTR_s00328p00009820 [Amborella trichopoda]|eukprot:XP_020517708.1 uncharacterized protein LOC18425501 [Amborella trichopoda]
MASSLHEVAPHPNFSHILSNTNWEEVTCPICLDFPHNGVLFQCSSYEKGCRPFVCDTNYTHSNCFNRFMNAYQVSSNPTQSENVSGTLNLISPGSEEHPVCPLCRGQVSGWVVIDSARTELNARKRRCEEEKCLFLGNYTELSEHMKLEHPHARPLEIDPARRLDWENLQQSSEIIDVLNTIHSEVPHGVVLGDYVIEYASVEAGDDYDDYHGEEGHWWISCIFDPILNLRATRNRRRGRRHSDPGDASSVAGGSSDIGGYGLDETDDEYMASFSSRRYNSSRRSVARLLFLCFFFFCIFLEHNSILLGSKLWSSRLWKPWSIGS